MKRTYFFMMFTVLLLFSANYMHASNEGYSKSMKTFKTESVSHKMPFICPFANQTEFDLWTVIDDNGDKKTWAEDLTAKAAKYSYSSANAGNDWLISPPLSLKAETEYRLRLDVKAHNANSTESMKVFVGQGATVGDQTAEELADYPVINSTSYSTKTITIKPSTTGNYNIGFYVYSAKNKYYLYLQNVIIENMSAPAAVSELIVTPTSGGVKSASITFKSPTLTIGGSSLPLISKIEIFRGETSVKVFENPDIGTNLTYIDDLTGNDSGIYSYRVVATNSSDEGASSTISTFIGEDIPTAPKNVLITKSGYNAVVSWIAPVMGVNNGWINSNTLTYKIIRNPGNNVVAESVTGDSFTDTNISELAAYTYTVQPKTSAGEGAAGTSNTLIVGNPFTIPYSCGFDSALQFGLWTVIDANGDNSTWKLYTSTLAAQYSYNKLNNADDWLISPPIYLKAGRYKLSYDYRATNASTPEKLKVFYGTGATVIDQRYEAMVQSEITNTTFLRQIVSVTIPEEEGGDWNFSFYACSPMNSNNMQVDNIVIEELFDKDLMALSIAGNQYPKANKEYPYSVTIKNNGAVTQNQYSVELIDAENNVLATQVCTETISANEVKTVIINYTPNEATNMEVRGKVVLVGDKVTSNDISTTSITVEVQPADGDDIILIGSGTEEATTLPIAFYYKSGVSQTIYLAGELEVENGQIKKLTYPYNNTNTKGVERALKVRMANTSLDNLSGGWIAQEELTLVYDGTAKIDAGTGKMEITLDTPFVYTGENICIMNISPKGDAFMNNVKFYLTSTTEALSRTYTSDSQEFDGTQVGTAVKKYPRVILQVDTSNAGQIEGMIKCNDLAVEGVKVTLNPTGLTSFTDENGFYQFNFVPAGSYTVSTGKLAYINEIKEDVIVEGYQTTVVDFTIDKLAKHKVSGIVKNTDGMAVVDATVRITGYETYDTTTGEDGTFAIQNVYKANDYKIKISKDGLMDYEELINVADEDYFFPMITMRDIPNKPYGITATITGENVTIAWKEPVPKTTFRYDDGIISGGVGLNGGTDKSVFGSTHHAPAILDSISWYTLGDYAHGGPHKTVSVFVFDLDTKGKPTTTVLFSQKNVENKDDKWTSFAFPTPVVCPNGFMIAIGYNGFLGIGHDAGTSTEYPFVANANYYSGDYTTGEYVALSGETSYNLAVRAKGIKTVAKDLAKEECKALKGYKVWRLLEADQTTEGNWNELTATAITELTYIDDSWGAAAQGIYKYAVKAIYSGDFSSDPILSNIVLKGMETDVTVNVTTDNNPNESEGATVTLTNIDEDNTHIYTGTVDATGKTIMENIWKGTYDVAIRHCGYTSVEIKNVEVTTDNPSLNYEISEKIIAPYNLKIEEVQLSSERVFSWVTSESIIEGFEGHKDFTVNSPGLTNWSYIDADGKETYSFTRYNFPNAGTPMAAIILNPFTTTPPMADAATTVHDGNKVLAFFCPKTSINNDWLISPKLSFPSDFTYSFWAKGYSEGFFKERIKIMYSTTGNSQADFTKTVTPTPTITTNDWVKYSYEIPVTAKYVALNCVSDNQYVLLVDDIFIGIEPVTRSLQKYHVYLDGVKVDETSESNYKFTDLKDGNHTAGVKAVYGSMTTEMTTIPFSVTISTYTIMATANENGEITPSGEMKVIGGGSQKYTMIANENYTIDDVFVDEKSIGNKAEYTFENVISNHTIKVTFKESDGVESVNSPLSLTMYPNPVKDILNIKGEYQSLEIFNTEGKLLITANGEAAINVSSLTNGVYIIKIYDNNRVGTYKMIK